MPIARSAKRPTTDSLALLFAIAAAWTVVSRLSVSVQGLSLLSTLTSPSHPASSGALLDRNATSTQPRSALRSTLLAAFSRHGRAVLLEAVPAVSVYRGVPAASQDEAVGTSTITVRERLQKPLEVIRDSPLLSTLSASELAQKNGFYYGISVDTYAAASAPTKSLSLSDSMSEALQELRTLRLEMAELQRDMLLLKQSIVPGAEGPQSEKQKAAYSAEELRQFARISAEVEEWADNALRETEDDGWKAITCNKMVRGSFNKDGQTQAFLKWMKDSRGDLARPEDDTEYPCIKCFSTIDAPLEDVCSYLSREDMFPEYNDVVEKYRDVEEISPDSKVCWSQSPQILFLKPRDFVTFCHHRWKKDGTQVIVNQACEHPDYPGSSKERDDGACRAYALRGINYIGRDPEDPMKTRMVLLAHASPGGNVPKWAMKTAVNALAPIEPFKLFHKINENVKSHEPELRDRLERTEMIKTVGPNGRSGMPAGMAQLGYACFWPNGGGQQEGAPTLPASPSNDDPLVGLGVDMEAFAVDE